MMKWITIKKLAELTGYTPKAIERKIEQGVFVEGIHYKYAPDHRRLMNSEAYEKWAEGHPVTVSNRGKRPSALPSSGADNAAANH